MKTNEEMSNYQEELKEKRRSLQERLENFKKHNSCYFRHINDLEQQIKEINIKIDTISWCRH